MTAARAMAVKTNNSVKAAAKNRPALLNVAPLTPLVPPAPGACACGGECPRCKAGALQKKRAITTPGDRFEREADRIAEHVMGIRDAGAGTPRGAAPAAANPPAPMLARAPCGACETNAGTREAASVDEALAAPGQPIDAATRDFMEPRFGADFTNVRVHTDRKAADSARAVDALAYTVGSNIVFGAGRYAPASPGGRRLLAHELAHVVQQSASGAPTMLARTASPSTFNCPANTNNSVDDPFAAIDDIDRHAQALAEASANLAIIASVVDPTTSPTATAQSYRDRFGTPVRQAGSFVNRFTGTAHATQEAAAKEEISEIGDRLDRLRTFLGGPIRYTCQRGGVQFHHSNCVSTCRPSDVAFSCVPQDSRRIEICPHFWDLTYQEQAIGIIHESAHMLLNFAHHGSGSRSARGRNPECYASFVADIFGITPFDTRCPVLP